MAICLGSLTQLHAMKQLQKSTDLISGKGWTVCLHWVLPGTVEHTNTILKSGKLGDLVLYECWMQKHLDRILKESSYWIYE